MTDLSLHLRGLDNEEPFEKCPLTLGSPLRAPEEDWGNWGIEVTDDAHREKLIEHSRQAYRDEWKDTTNVGHEHIAQAAIQAGLSDANRTMNEMIATAVSQRIDEIRTSGNSDVLHIADIGAGTGNTIKAALTAMGEVERKRVHVTLIDPASKALTEAVEALTTELLNATQLTIFNGEERNVLPAHENEFDIVMSSAAVHHHASLKEPFSAIAGSMKSGSDLFIGDWHNVLSNHPSHTLRLLESLDWPQKTEAMQLFLETYPEAKTGRRVPQGQLAGLQGIINFWVEYAKIAPGKSPFIVLEGHRPARRYVTELQKAGLDVTKYSKDVLDNSELLCVTKATKLAT